MEPQRASRSRNQQMGTGFGKFLVELAGFLTVQIVLSLAVYFEFSNMQKDRLQGAEYPGQLMVDCLRERGIITQTDISPLIKALEDLKLDGVKLEVISSFQSYLSTIHQSGGKLKILQNGLKAVYKIFYKSIRPIPYIRDKLYCVDEVFVDSGVQLGKGSEKSIPSHFTGRDSNKTENIVLKSYYDIFDTNVISSKRIIVEGEPGYGKSTLTLQAAYDWCTAKSSSPLAGIEVFILLQFRLLRGIKSIYKAIKLLALPRDCILTENDIKEILSSCTRVVIILDGFDEYPDMTTDLDSDMMAIIKGEMFADQRTIVFTRTGCLPKHIDPDTIYVRLTGFDDAARDQYIQIAVGATSDLADEIKRDLDENPIMSDLCQVPLFFAMFAHLSSDNKDVLKCDSVTQFFTYMLRCFYDHMLKKTEGSRPHDRLTRGTADKAGLCKLAFEGLTGEKQTLVWEKQEFIDNAGKECCDELIKIGILVEEESLSEVTDSSGFKHGAYKPVIRFYHKIFTEWYAAHHLGELAKNFWFFRNLRLGYILQRIDPQDVQFVFRFACGLNPITFKSIFKYLDGFNTNVATLCIFEAERKIDEIKGIVRQMCSEETILDTYDSRLLQRSKIQLFTIASRNKIPVSSVVLIYCFQSVDLKEECLCLSSGLQLPRLDTLKELEIFGGVDLRDRTRDILDYSSRCMALKTLKLRYVLLQRSFDDKDVLARLHGKNCKVEWYTYYLDCVKLNLQTGKWEKQKNGQQMTDDEYRREMASFGLRENLGECDANFKKRLRESENSRSDSELFKEEFINDEGGTLSLSKAEVCLEIPAKALTHGHKIQIRVPLDCAFLLSQVNVLPRLTPLIICEPEGLKFMLPVKLTLPHCAVIEKPENHTVSVKFGSKNKKTNEWKWTPEDVEYTLTRKSCTLFLKHFTAVSTDINSTKEKILRVIPYAKLRPRTNTVALTLWFSNDLESDFQSALQEAEKDHCVPLDSYDTFTLRYAEEDETVSADVTDVCKQWNLNVNKKIIDVGSLSRTNKLYREFKLIPRSEHSSDSYVYLILQITQNVGDSQRETKFALRKRISDLTTPFSFRNLYSSAENGDTSCKPTEHPADDCTAVPYIDPMKHCEDDVIVTLWICPFERSNKKIQRLQKEQELQRKHRVRAGNSFALPHEQQTVTATTRFSNGRWDLTPVLKDVETKRIRFASRAKFQFIGRKKEKDGTDYIDLEVTVQGKRQPITFSEEVEIQQLLYESRQVEEEETSRFSHQGAAAVAASFEASATSVIAEKVHDSTPLAPADAPGSRELEEKRDDDLRGVFLYLKTRTARKWKDIGRYLDLEEGYITNVDMQYNNDISEGIYQMLLHWKQTKSRNATIVQLKNALSSAGEKRLADAIEKGEHLS